MLRPIYEKDTVLYGNDGRYTLKQRIGNSIECEFVPWDAEKLIQVREIPIKELNEILNIQLLWAVFDD